MKAMRWILMLVFTALILAGVKGGNAKAAGCWISNPDGSHDDNYFGMEETGREPATCETDEIIHLRCKGYQYGCDYTEDVIGEKRLGHDYKLVNTATCTKSGEEMEVCSRCQAKQNVKKVDALGHDFSVMVKTVAPTCTSQGYTEYKCSRCEATEKRDFVAADGKTIICNKLFSSRLPVKLLEWKHWCVQNVDIRKQRTTRHQDIIG